MNYLINDRMNEQTKECKLTVKVSQSGCLVFYELDGDRACSGCSVWIGVLHTCNSQCIASCSTKVGVLCYIETVSCPEIIECLVTW